VVLPQHDTLCPALPPALKERLQAAGALSARTGVQGPPGTKPLVLELPRPFATAITTAPALPHTAQLAAALRYLQAQIELADAGAKRQDGKPASELDILQTLVATPLLGVSLNFCVQVGAVQSCGDGDGSSDLFSHDTGHRSSIIDSVMHVRRSGMWC
jgi:hypothetical protein